MTTSDDLAPAPHDSRDDGPGPRADAVDQRANLLAEEEAAGSDDPRQQAEAILEESSARVLTPPEQADGSGSVERRTSADTVAPPDL
ncbi:MAG TPA: hypothetical protein VIK61_02520 [Acidimicrobiia bacterium]